MSLLVCDIPQQFSNSYSASHIVNTINRFMIYITLYCLHYMHDDALIVQVFLRGDFLKGGTDGFLKLCLHTYFVSLVSNKVVRIFNINGTACGLELE